MYSALPLLTSVVVCVQVHHKRLIAACAGGDFSIACPSSSFQLANHYGDMRLANWYMDECMQFAERMLAEPERSFEAFTLLFFLGYCKLLVVMLSRFVRFPSR